MSVLFSTFAFLLQFFSAFDGMNYCHFIVIVYRGIDTQPQQLFYAKFVYYIFAVHIIICVYSCVGDFDMDVCDTRFDM